MRQRSSTRYLIVAMACAALAFVCTAVAFAQSTLAEVTSHTSTAEPSNSFWEAQTFLVDGSGTVEFTAARSRLLRISTGAGDIQAAFYTTTGGEPDSAPGGEVCTSLNTVSINDLTADSNGEIIEWNFPTCPSQPAGTYALVIYEINDGAGDWGIRLDNTDPYADGARYIGFDDGDAWGESSGLDLTFRVSGNLFLDPTPTPTPTPNSSGYQYITTVTATLATSASDQTDVAVQFPINALNLANSGYLDDEGQGVLVLQNTAPVLPTVHSGVNEASWWIPFLGTTEPGETRSADIYTSGDPSPLRSQSLWLENASESVDVPDDNSLDITDELTIDIEAFEVVALPESDACLLCKDNAYELYLNGATLTADVTTAGGVETLTYNEIAVDTPYNVKLTFDDGDDLVLSIDSVQVDSATGLSTTIDTSAATVTIDAWNGWMGRARVGGTDVDSPTYVLDLQFEPTHLTQTDEGDAGDGWTWEGTVEDQSASENDGTYLFVRDMSIWTVDVGPLASNVTLPRVLLSNELADLVDLPGIATAPGDDLFTGDDDFEDIMTSSGLTTTGTWFLFVTFIVGALGTLAVRMLAWAFVGTLIASFGFFAAAMPPLSYIAPMWAAIAIFLTVSISTFMAWQGKR